MYMTFVMCIMYIDAKQCLHSSIPCLRCKDRGSLNTFYPPFAQLFGAFCSLLGRRGVDVK